MRKTISYTDMNDDGDEFEVELEAEWSICDRCYGDGTHGHPAFSDGITGEEWSEWSHEEQDQYRSGFYDVKCEECKGSGKVLTPVKPRSYTKEEDRKKYERWLELEKEEADFEALCAAERRMGA